MRFRVQPWQLTVLLVLICVGTLAGIYLYRTRGGSNPSELVAHLPIANATVVYIDVGAIRRAGILDMIAGSKAAADLEYQQFVDDTLFDYRQDLDAIAAAFKDGQVFFALRGRFHWKNLMDYTIRQGGGCHNSFCSIKGSQPQRSISFYPVKPDLMALAMSSDNLAAYQVTRKIGKLALTPPSQPVWVLVPSLALRNPDALPAGTKSYATALAGKAEEILFSLGPEGDHLAVSLDVSCRDAESASTLLVDFENTTNTLRKWIAREHQQPNPTDLSSVLVAGTFRREDRRVYGQWPISRAFVEKLASESY